MNSFIIDAAILATKSTKPRHTEERLRTRSCKRDSLVEQNRTEFINARTEKLKNRDLHVKKVVSEAKEKRSSVKSRLDVDMMRAESLRKEHLIKVSLQNKLHVEKAKERAELHQRELVKASNERKSKIESRQKIVASRRQHLLTLPRSRLLDLQSWSLEDLVDLKSSLDDSARIIQLWWLERKFSFHFKNWKQSGIAFSKAKQSKFPILVKHLQQKRVIDHCFSMISYLKKLSPTKVDWKNESRIFLGAFMIAAHPKEAMPTNDIDSEVFNN